MKAKTYEPIGCDIEVLKIEHLYAKVKPGERAEELLDKITEVIESMCEEGDWQFKWDIEG